MSRSSRTEPGGAQENNAGLLLEDKDPEMRAMAKKRSRDWSPRSTRSKARCGCCCFRKTPTTTGTSCSRFAPAQAATRRRCSSASFLACTRSIALEHGWRVELMSANATGIGGFKEIIAMVTGQKVYSKLKYESGVHRVQRVPATEAQGRVHTSTVTVAVLPEAKEVDVTSIRTISHQRLPLRRTGRAGRQHDRLGRADHAPADRPGRASARTGARSSRTRTRR